MTDIRPSPSVPGMTAAISSVNGKEVDDEDNWKQDIIRLGRGFGPPISLALRFNQAVSMQEDSKEGMDDISDSLVTRKVGASSFTLIVP